MAENAKIVVNVADLPLDHSSKGSRFACATGEIGQTLGLDVLGAMLHVVPAGKTAFPMHRHHVSDEMFFVLEGAGEYRTDKGTFPIKPGDCLGAPAGGIAHQIINTGANDLKYIGFSNNTNAEVVEYTDTGTLLVAAGPKGIWYGDSTYKVRTGIAERGYWDGEDIGDDDE
ncbi:MAG: cupin domain-containing protein [Hyphomicrobiaceae bacterium]|nr:cupin domain-containing protein [Hyphomicrobiaceae bacterium]MCC0023538.1 cupin domain-containing protein [Hyphomicrobiaceae bacterium]